MKKTFLFLSAIALMVSSVTLSSCNTTSITSTTSQDVNQTSTIIISKGITNGKVSLSSGSTTVNKGENVELIVEPNNGYAIENVTLNGEILDAPYQFSVNLDTYYVDANFIKDTASLGQTSIEVPTLVSLGVNKQKQIDYTVYGPDNTLIWASADESIAKVDQNGQISGISSGFATINVTSIYDEDVSEKILVYVMPTYVEDMVNSFSNYSYSTGVQLGADVLLTLDGDIFSGSPAKFSIPLDLDILLDTNLINLEENKSSLHLSLDFQDSLSGSDSGWGQTIFYTMVYGMLLPELFTSFPGIDDRARSLDVYLDKDLVLRSAFSQYDNSEEITQTSDYTITAYQESDLFDVLGSGFSTIGGLLSGLLPTLLPLISTGNFDLSLLTILNQFLVYEENAIHLSSDLITQLDTLYQEFVNVTLPTLLPPEFAIFAPIIKMLLPTNISDVYLQFNYSESNIFEGVELIVEANCNITDTSTGEASVKTFEFVTINLYKNKDLDADYFTTLNNELNSMLEEYNIINPVFEQLTQLKTYFETTLSSKPALAKLDNTYLEMQLEAMNAYLGLTDDFKEFVDLPTAVYPLIDETLTVNSVALQGYINSENCTTYDVKVGDVISLDFALFNFEESSDAIYNISSGYKYITVDNENKTITINEKPTNGTVTFTLSGQNLFNGLNSISETIYLNVVE